MAGKIFYQRTITTVLLALSVWFVTYILPAWVFTVIVCCCIGIALYEFYIMVEHKGIFVYKYFGTALGALAPLITYSRSGVVTHEVQPFFIVLISIFVIIMQFARKSNVNALNGISITLFGILYIGWFLGYLIKLRLLPDGANLILFLILVTKIADVGAYLIGSVFGKHSLIPRISPKKTLEGLLGAVLFSSFSAVSFRFLIDISVYHAFIVGVLISVLGQVGDLSESLIKRDCGIKDSSRLFPGIGGMLDLIDSVLFSAPIFYFYIIIIISR